MDAVGSGKFEDYVICTRVAKTEEELEAKKPLFLNFNLSLHNINYRK